MTQHRVSGPCKLASVEDDEKEAASPTDAMAPVALVSKQWTLHPHAWS